MGSGQVPRPYKKHFPPQAFNRLGYISKKEIDTIRADAYTYGNVALQVRQGLTLCLFSYPTENPHLPFDSEQPSVWQIYYLTSADNLLAFPNIGEVLIVLAYVLAKRPGVEFSISRVSESLTSSILVLTAISKATLSLNN